MATKRPTSIKRFVDPIGKTVNFILYDNVKNAPIPGFALHFDMKKMNPALIEEAALMGCNHSIGDEAALPQGATFKQKFDAMRERAEWLESGTTEWVGARGSGEGSILFAALMLEKPDRNPVELRKILANKSASDKNKMMVSPRLRELVDQVRSERAKEIDEDELFADLDV